MARSYPGSSGLGLGAAGIAAASPQRGKVTFGGLPVPGATVLVSRGDQKLSAITDPQGAYSFAGSRRRFVGRSTSRCRGSRRFMRDVMVEADGPASEWPLAMLPFAEVMKGCSGEGSGDARLLLRSQTVTAAAPATAVPASGCAFDTGEGNLRRTENMAARAAPQKAGGFQRADVNASAASSSTSSAADAVPTNTGVPANGGDPDLAQRASDGFLINGSSNNGAASSVFAECRVR